MILSSLCICLKRCCRRLEESLTGERVVNQTRGSRNTARSRNNTRSRNTPSSRNNQIRRGPTTLYHPTTTASSYIYTSRVVRSDVSMHVRPGYPAGETGMVTVVDGPCINFGANIPPDYDDIGKTANDVPCEPPPSYDDVIRTGVQGPNVHVATSGPIPQIPE